MSLAKVRRHFLTIKDKTKESGKADGYQKHYNECSGFLVLCFALSYDHRLLVGHNGRESPPRTEAVYLVSISVQVFLKY